MITIRRLLVHLTLLMVGSYVLPAQGAVVPTCGLSPDPGLTHEVYRTNGFNTSPANETAFQTLVDNFAVPANLDGQGLLANINGSGNPFSLQQNNFLTRITGYIDITQAGTYQFAVDGDDAVEVRINGNVVSSFYGLHAAANAPINAGSVVLDVGFHEVEFRHHEFGGQDSYTLYMQSPSDAGLSIAPTGIFFSCGSILVPDVTPSCPMPFEGLALSVYDRSSVGGHPNDAAQYQNLIDTIAVPGNLFGSGVVPNVNGSGNPFGSDENYLQIFTGWINVPVDGVYEFGVDGDDAVEVRVNNTIVSAFYGGHGRSGGPVNTGAIGLEAGFHTIEFRHEEINGGDNYFLFWRPPGDAAFSIVPLSVLFNCDQSVIDSSLTFTAAPLTCATPDPGLVAESFDKTGFGHPNTEAEFQTLVDNFAIPANSFGTGIIGNVNGFGNPFGTNQDYLLIFKGLFQATETGLYQFAVDGDDAVEVRINGTVVSDFYGAHGRSGGPVDATLVNLSEVGFYEVEFRHEEVGGGDNYFLFSQAPSEASLAITPTSRLFHCPEVPFISIANVTRVVGDPINGVTQPKNIPGAEIEYTLEVENRGEGSPDSNSVIIADNIDPDVEMFIGDFDGAGSPIQFVDGIGAEASGLSLNFIDLASTVDDVLFSNDNGATFTYIPTDLDGDGYDPLITNFQVNLQGQFNALVPPANPPTFDLVFRVRLK